MSNNSSIKKKTITGLAWSTIEKFIVKGFSLVFAILLARILSPTDYGLIGMLMVFTTLSSTIIESGFAKALIQKQDRTNLDFSTVFYFNFGISILIYGILFFSAPYVANFYREPLLIPLLRMLSLNIVIGSLNVVQRAKLMIQMDFKTLAKVNFAGTLAGGLAGVGMAYSGFGVWSLVGQALVATLALWILFNFYTKWRPLWAFSIESLKSLFGFGSKLLISGVYATIMNEVNSVVIGKAYDTVQLGFYSRAIGFTRILVNTINQIIGTVTFPILSELQSERKRMISIYSRSLRMTAFFVFPVMILFAALAKPFVLLLLTEKWLPAVVLIQILCFARILTPMSVLNMNILNATGRSDLFLKADLIKFPLVVLRLIITIPLGVKAIVIGTVVTTFIAYFINAYYPGKLFGYGAIDQLKDSYKIFLSAILMGTIVFILIQIIPNLIFQLVIGGVLGFGLYILFSLLFRSNELQEVVALIKTFRNRND